MPRISSEFAAFVRGTGVRAFNHLAEGVKEVHAPLRPVLRAWIKLSEDQKDQMLDELIASAQSDVPAAGGTASAKPANADIRRYDPEEVETTLPVRRAKPRKKASPKKKT